MAPDIVDKELRIRIIVLTCTYLSYLISKNIEFSGKVTLFRCGFIMAHYAYFNKSRVAQKGSKIAV